MKTQLHRLEGIKGEDLMRMLATLKIEDPTITKILPNYQDTVAIEAQLTEFRPGRESSQGESLARDQAGLPKAARGSGQYDS